MFGTVRNKINLLPVAIVFGGIAGVFFAESGVKFVKNVNAASIIDMTVDAVTPGSAPIDPDSFVRIDGGMYSITADASVDMTATSSTVVKKISGGHVFNVNIATTPTGTYSTDSLQSNHVLYPGIDVERAYPVHVSSAGFVYTSKRQAKEIATFLKQMDGIPLGAAITCKFLTSYAACK